MLVNLGQDMQYRFLHSLKKEVNLKSVKRIAESNYSNKITNFVLHFVRPVPLINCALPSKAQTKLSSL